VHERKRCGATRAAHVFVDLTERRTHVGGDAQVRGCGRNTGVGRAGNEHREDRRGLNFNALIQAQNLNRDIVWEGYLGVSITHGFRAKWYCESP